MTRICEEQRKDFLSSLRNLDSKPGASKIGRQQVLSLEAIQFRTHYQRSLKEQ